MRVLFIAPVPPPITGHAIASEVLLNALTLEHDVALVNTSKDSFKEGVDGVKRILEVAGFIREVWKKKHGADAVYLTISESLAGNIKDLCIYLACYKLLPKMYIHLHGGSIKKQLWDRYALLHRINRFFIAKFAGVIICGGSHKNIFDGLIAKEKIHIVPNFSLDYLFSTEEGIVRKFSDMQPLRILYMSNLRPKKGYNDLADAFFCLPDKFRHLIRLDFAGSFDSESSKNAFLEKIAGIDQIKYHGQVEGKEKEALFKQSHVFCLPTCYFEGQPISILEAYASGCVVLTTAQSGIRDIFEDEVNGFEVDQRSPASIAQTIEKILLKGNEVQNIALKNRKLASEKYRVAAYNSSIARIIES